MMETVSTALVAAVMLVLVTPLFANNHTGCVEWNGKVRKSWETWKNVTRSGVFTECTCAHHYFWQPSDNTPGHISCYLTNHCRVGGQLRRRFETWLNDRGELCKCGLSEQLRPADEAPPAYVPSVRCYRRTCPAYWELSGDHCYMVLPCTKRRCAAREARSMCAHFGGRPARVTSTGVVNTLLASVRKHAALGLDTVKLVHIDGNDKRREGRWVYSRGRPMRYSHWRWGQPSRSRSRNCARMYVNRAFQILNGRFADFSCNAMVYRRYVAFACEMASVWGQPSPPLILRAPFTRH